MLQLETQLVDLQLDAGRPLRESTQLNYYDQAIDPREPLFDSQDFWLPIGYAESLPINLDNRLRGEVLPVYLTWHGLKIVRDQCRKLAGFNEFAINAHENRVNYIVGKGLTYKAVRKHAAPTPEGRKDPLAQAVQEVVDDFIDANDWALREQEGVKRFDRDGEAIFRLFHTGGGRAEVRAVEPELLYAPDDANDRTFGVETTPGDVEDVQAYWIVEDPSARGMNSVRVPAEEIVHIKANVDSTAKRGLPTLFPVRKNLERADKLLRNMSLLAQVQATFALIRKHRRAGASAVSAFQQAQRDVTITTPVTGKTISLQKYQPGSILDADADTEYEFPAGTVRADALVAILQAELRAIAARLVMPEYMLTANAENANYSSTLVAESPSVKNFERLQALFARHYGDGSWHGERKSGVLWRVIWLAVQWGRLPAEALTEIELQVEGPSLIVRDKVAETQRGKTLNDAGVISKHTWASWEGVDYDQEQEKLSAEPKPAPHPMPGQPPARETGDLQQPAPESLTENIHAPKGGVTVAGKHFAGGEFIPAEVLRKASPDEIADIRAKQQAAAGSKSAGHHAVAELVAKSLRTSGVPDAQERAYRHAADQVIGRLSEKAAERLAKNVSSATFYSDTEALTRALAAKNSAVAEQMSRGARVNGAYAPQTGALHLDGGGLQAGERLAEAGVYAHEFGHAIDGRAGAKISEGEAWRSAWRHEMEGSALLSKYAAKSPAEGFAELSRALHGGAVPRADLEKHFPKSLAVWRSEGLI